MLLSLLQYCNQKTQLYTYIQIYKNEEKKQKGKKMVLKKTKLLKKKELKTNSLPRLIQT